MTRPIGFTGFESVCRQYRLLLLQKIVQYDNTQHGVPRQQHRILVHCLDLFVFNFAVYSTNAFQAYAVAIAFDRRHEFALHHDTVRFFISLRICDNALLFQMEGDEHNNIKNSTQYLEIIKWRFIDHYDVTGDFLLNLVCWYESKPKLATRSFSNRSKKQCNHTVFTASSTISSSVSSVTRCHDTYCRQGIAT